MSCVLIFSHHSLQPGEKLLCVNSNEDYTGCYGVARYSADGLLYRCRIVRKTGPNVEVIFVDYGNQETVHHSEIFTLEHEFATLPAFGIFCSWSSPPLPDAQLKPLILEQTIEVHLPTFMIH